MATNLPAVERHGNGWRSEIKINGRREKITVHAENKREAQKEVARIKLERRLLSGDLSHGALTITMHHAIDLFVSDKYDPERDGETYVEARRVADDLKSRLDPRILVIDFQTEELVGLIKLRRKETVLRIVDGEKIQKPVSAATVNRTVTEFISRVFKNLEVTKQWHFPKKPKFVEHRLSEPKQRIRHLFEEEYAALVRDDIRDDYHQLLRFSLLTGMRQANTVYLRRDQVRFNYDKTRKLTGGIATIPVKTEGSEKREIEVSLSIAACEILLAQQHEDGTPYHPVAFFTYEVVRTRDGRTKGGREPMTRSGLRTWWRRWKGKAGIKNYRWHDNRHTAATEILHATGDLSAVQSQLGHLSIGTTMKYAHIKQDARQAAVEAASQATPWGNKAA